MTVFEIVLAIYGTLDGEETAVALSIGILLGIWMLCLVSYLNMHVAWK